MEINLKQEYYMDLVVVEEYGDSASYPWAIFDAGAFVSDVGPTPITEKKFSTQEKALNWWFHQCENDGVIRGKASEFTAEAKRYRESVGSRNG